MSKLTLLLSMRVLESATIESMQTETQTPLTIYLVWTLCLLLALTGLALLGVAQSGLTAATVTVEWDTATEIDTVGFNLYRSTNPEGPFEQVNNELIPSSTDPLVGGAYSYVDTDVSHNTTYYYELEDVNANGSTTRHGPIEVAAADAGNLPLLGGGLLAVALLGSGMVLFLQWWRRSPAAEAESAAPDAVDPAE